MTLPRPAPRVHTFFVEEEALVFREDQQELHRLNATAAYIWRGVLEGRGRRQVVEDVQSRFEVSAAEASRLIGLAVRDWDSRGFTAGAGQDKPSLEPPADEGAHVLLSAANLQVASTRSYCLLGCHIRIRFGTTQHEDLVHPVIAHLESDADRTDVTLESVVNQDGIAVIENGVPRLTCRGPEELAPAIKGLLWSLAINRYRFLIGFHAGVVANSRGAVLLAGASGSGKSTLTAKLVHSGFQYFSDEFALLRESDLRVVAVPLAVCVKEKGLEALASEFPGLSELPVHTRFDGKRVVYLPPPKNRLAASGAHAPARAIVFPTYIPRAQANLNPVRPIEALSRLLSECVAIPRPLTRETVQQLVTWIQDRPSWCLTFGNASEAVQLIRSTAESELQH